MGLRENQNKDHCHRIYKEKDCSKTKVCNFTFDFQNLRITQFTDLEWRLGSI